MVDIKLCPLCPLEQNITPILTGLIQNRRNITDKWSKLLGEHLKLCPDLINRYRLCTKLLRQEIILFLDIELKLV